MGVVITCYLLTCTMLLLVDATLQLGSFTVMDCNGDDLQIEDNESRNKTVVGEDMLQFPKYSPNMKPSQ